MTRHSPSNDPKFHIDLMLAGVGKSFKAPLIILIRGCVFLIDIIYLNSLKKKILICGVKDIT